MKLLLFILMFCCGGVGTQLMAQDNYQVISPAGCADAEDCLDALFPGCGEDFDCSYMKMSQFIFSNLKHPQEAKDAGVEGEVKVKFTINTEGKVADPSITEGLGHGCDEEVLRVINLMPDGWLVGESGGAKIDMVIELSIKFIK